ncbi:sensor histidine kinase [Janthinobacterium sp. PC23-8]|uniref:sensor histidine kinase n=1 Tax=Janthinobacterium sp. PC23-8 TaxID=2012679 RepID=UPI000B978A1C|nr:HAMP domain-containing sensor histidine kinase [Janthinobacterium sp. PC23-8]OYO30495.1 two-component sensor histidine kinase [Janthinobacterium sp. PC23-8]
MEQQWQASGAHWRRRLRHSLLQERASPQNLAARVALLAAVGTVTLPLYYLLWQFFFPQAYENLSLRLTGVLICVVGLFARRLPPRWLSLYLLVALSYVLPFFFTFMFVMNHASPIWSESLLIGLVVLFHFETGLACRAYLTGTIAACLAVILEGEGAFLLRSEMLQQLPVHWFTIAALSVVKVGRKVLEQEKLAGMAAGLGSVAHELRTPLTSVEANVRGLRRLMAKAECSNAAQAQPVQEALSRIVFEVRHMHHMIDLFLLSASAVNRKLAPNQALSMLEMVNAVLKRYPFASNAQRDSVTVDLRSDFQFAGQDELCVVILLNLLRNALKAVQRAGKGRVRIIIDGARPMPRLLVIDTGCGIAPDRLPRIFERFYSYPVHNGSGIGLALCRQIIDAWQARIRCVSREHAYAIFILEFPCRYRSASNSLPLQGDA